MPKRLKEPPESTSDRDEFLAALGQRVKLARNTARLTQKQLAEKIGASPSWVFLVEDGQQNPMVDSLRRAAVALGVPLHSLLPVEPEAFGPDGSSEAESMTEAVIEDVSKAVADLNRTIGKLHKINVLRVRKR